MWGIKVRVTLDDWRWVTDTCNAIPLAALLFKTQFEAENYARSVGWKMYEVIFYKEN
jgi:hypothetical protein